MGVISDAGCAGISSRSIDEFGQVIGVSRKFRSVRWAGAHSAALLLVAAAAALCLATAVSALGATQRPAPPTHLTASAVTRTSLSLEWRRSSGPGRIVRYRVYRGRRQIGRTSATRFAVSHLHCGTTYAFGVRAVDAAGRRSRRAVRWVRTDACVRPDTEPPSAPSALAQSEPSSTAIDLTWLPATDNVRVAGYRVSRDGLPIARTAETNLGVGGLACGTAYIFTVVAYDAAGNESLPASLSASTAACSAPAPCDGVAVAPGDDLEALAASKPAGTVFCIAPGTYRVRSQIKPRDGQQFIGTGPGVVVTGGVPLSGFVHTGATWVAAGAPSTPAFAAGSGFSSYLHPQAPYANDVTLDGALLEKVGVRTGGVVYGDPASTVGPGTYFVDYDAGTVTLGTDPTGHDVELGMGYNGFGSTASDVVIRDMRLKLFTFAGVQMLPGASGWAIQDVSVSAAHDSGVKLNDGALLERGTLSWNGRYGLNARGANVTVDGVEVSHSDAAHYLDGSGGCVAAGGSKFVGTTGLVLRNSVFHDNLCNGIWLDVDTYDSTIVNNTSIGNEDDGIRIEVSHRLRIADNTVRDNGGWGIYLSNAPDADVWSNMVAGNGHGAIVLNWSGRTTPVSTYGSYATSNVDVHDNTMVLTASDQVVGIVDKTGTGYPYSDAANNRYHANHYVLPDVAWRYFRLEVKMPWSSWRTAGMDTEYALM
jgi:parallel beta-helix repeat protein